jgi:hypothetical protein
MMKYAKIFLGDQLSGSTPMTKIEEIFEMLVFVSTLIVFIAWEDLHTYIKIKSLVFNMILGNRRTHTVKAMGVFLIVNTPEKAPI